MLEDRFNEVYSKFKLHFYRETFARFQNREASLTTVESFAMEAIYALKCPTVREFARFDPVNLWFDYPVHKLDTGLLEDLQPETEMQARGRAGAAKRWPGGKEGAAQKSKIQLSDAFEACTMDGEVTVYAMAEYLDLKPATVKKRLRADGGYWIDGEKVGRKEPGYKG